MKKLMIVLCSLSFVLLTAVPSLGQDSLNVRQLGFYGTPRYASDVAVSGNYAYVADGQSGLRVVNITNPSLPVEVGFYDTPGNAYGVAVSGSYAYVADYGSGLRVVNITNPAAPTSVGFYDTPGYAWGVAVSGNYAYVADGQSGLRVVNITNPSAPVEAGFYNTPGYAYGVAVSENYAYVADGYSGLRVVDITNPALPVEMGFYDTPGRAMGVAVAGNYAYVADDDYGLRVVNITGPALPTEAGFYDTPVYAMGVAVSGSYAYVADREGGLRVVNITNPTAPSEAGFYDTPGYAYGVAVQGNIAYVADYYYGLGIYDCSAAMDYIDYILPVELLSFSASAGDAQVFLRWQTASETGSDRFEIERDGMLIQRTPAAGDATGHSYSWTDRDVSNGQSYHYALWSVELNGERGLLRETDATPRPGIAAVTEYALRGNYPNPFNPTTEIAFDLPEAGTVSLKVFDLMGREVAVLVNGEKPAGRHTISFDARDLPSGMYICWMTANEFMASRKMMLIR